MSSYRDIVQDEVDWIYRLLPEHTSKGDGLVKKVGGAAYFHIETVDYMPEEVRETIQRWIDLTGGYRFDVVKVQASSKNAPPSLSFLQCPLFFEVAFPTVEGYLTWQIGKDKKPTYTEIDNANPPIYHRKHLFLSPKHPQYRDSLAVTSKAENLGLFRDAAPKLWNRADWDEWLFRNGYDAVQNEILETRSPYPRLPLDEMDSPFSSGGICVPFRSNFPKLPRLYSVEEEIAGMKATPQSTARAGKFAESALVPRAVAAMVNHDSSILDFGSGKAQVHTKALNRRGFKVTAHDFSSPNPDALKRQYDVVFASNVLNTQGSEYMAAYTIDQIYRLVRIGGYFIANYPKEPRYCPYRVWELLDRIASYFGSPVQLLSWKGKVLPSFDGKSFSAVGNAGAPVFIVRK